MLQTNLCYEMEMELETIKPKSAISNRSNKLTKTFQKVIGFQTSTKIASNKGKNEATKVQKRAIMEALIAKLFAGVTTIKTAYAELQIAQNPYNNEVIQEADKFVVDELRAMSELKRSFMQKELKFSPQVTLMLAQIQEQQSLMKTYQITLKKLEAQVDVKDSEFSFLKKQLGECVGFNKSLEKKLNSSGVLSLLDNLHLSALNPNHFVQFFQCTLRSIKSFVKLMIREMESAHWNLEAAIKFIHQDAVFTSQDHHFFAFESFVCITMFEGFNFPNFMVPNQPLEKFHHHTQQHLCFEKFKKIKALNLTHYLAHNSNSSFAGFLKSKYLQMVHAKMECSLFGNLNQRKLLNNGGVPDSAFFMAFAEMAKRVWGLHFLAFSFQEQVAIFQVKKNTRFSEVYMECVPEQQTLKSGEALGSKSGDLRVSFTVVPGFKIGKTVIRSQVYLSPVSSSATY